MFQSGGENQMWPTSGPSGYITPAVLVSYASERGTKSDVPTSGPGGYITPAVWGVLYASERATKSEVAQKWPRNGPKGLKPSFSFRGSEAKLKKNDT